MNHLNTTFLISTLTLGLIGCDLQDNEPPTAVASETSEVVPASTKTFVFSVKGMSCGGCASAVDTKVEKVDGVMACDVSLEQQKATVELAEGGSATDVEEAIRSLGYTVEPESTNPAS